MGKLAKLPLCVAILGLAGMDSMNTALASPPGSHRVATAHSALDLRPPANALVPAENFPPIFPSSMQRHSLGGKEDVQLPAMGAGVAHGRTPSRAEEFARRVHREGLPVARIWENKSALLSLGLNKKGKPGLWIIQKIR